MWLTTVGAIVMLALGILAAPLATDAQPPGKVYRIGMLEMIPTAPNAANLDAFRHGLRELGYVEGHNLVIDYRSADGHAERFPDLATELVRLQVNLILTRGTPAALAAKHATGTIPVVITGVSDPVEASLVASLAHPGGNVTGLSSFGTPLYGKRVELLRELVPGATRIAALFNMSNPALPPQWYETERAARALGVQPQLLDVRQPEDVAPAFDAAITQRADALVVAIDALTQAHRRPIVELAAKHRLPAIYAAREFVDAGGLIAYGLSYSDMYHRAASFVHKILTGTKPADLPVEQPMKFELIINLITAKALGITVPPSLLLLADEVIQ